MSDPSAFVIFNPSAGRGRGTRRKDYYLQLLNKHLPAFEQVETRQAGDERALVDAALERGHRKIVAVGGDGTWSIVADRIIRSGRRDAVLGLLPAGTGNDFGKSLGIVFERSEQVVRAIAEGRSRTIDVGRVGQRHFLNVVGFGFDIAVIDDATRVPFLRGDALYRFCALRQLFRFPGLDLELRDEGGRGRRSKHLMLIIANARFFGGTFRIAPEARLADGKLDAVSIGDVGPWQRMRVFGMVAKGTHARAANVEIIQSRRFRIEFDAPVQYEVDGEVYPSETNVVETESVPNALNVFVPEQDGRRA